jgi:type IV fimbrial biogenesis protein FimT
MQITKSRQNGVTLIELLVTMTIAAILLAIGLPSYNGITTTARMKGEMFSFLADMSFARSEAIKRGQPVYICSTTDNITCNDTPITNNNSVWTTGRLVYVDTTNSGLVSTPTLTSVLRISPSVTHGDTFTNGSAIEAYPTGYEAMTGTASLHDASDDPSQRRCFDLSGGTASVSTGGACP